MFLVGSKVMCYNNFLGKLKGYVMRCTCCDCDLTDYESTRRYEEGEYLDMCNNCSRSLDSEIATVNRMDLLSIGDEE